MDSIHLDGSENVSRAGSNMTAAANTIQTAVNTLDSALSYNMQFLNEWMDRFEAAINKLAEIESTRLPEGWKLHD
jgi:cysteine sulfinate desulfinase/cysteine desulfurase-like protein